jgi:hypothetical protein
MSSIQTKQFNWLSRPSAWQSVQNWRERHRAHQNQADTTFASSADLFSSAISGFGTGMAEFAARQAASRISEALAAKDAAQRVDTTA